MEITASTPQDDTFFETFPGAFEGETEGGETVPFISYGYMGVSMYSEGRAEPLELADGVTASLALTIDPAAARSAPPTIPMWWFDEDRGVWVEEGEATLEGNVYTTDVEHFTIWNWDLPVTDICYVTGQVQDGEGEPVEGARVRSQGQGCTFMDEVFTDAGGWFTIRSIKECTSLFWAMKGTYVSQNEEMGIGTDDAQDLPNPLVLTVPAFYITLAWDEHPRDMDAQLLIPMSWDPMYDFFHIYYSNRGTFATHPYTELDTDATQGYGPEIISGARLYGESGRLAPGTYSYYVKHYSGSGHMGSSPARVTLEIGNYYNTWNASTAGGEFHEGGSWIEDGTMEQYYDFWHVFNFTVSPSGGVSVDPVNRAVGSTEWDGPWYQEGYEIYNDWWEGEGRIQKPR